LDSLATLAAGAVQDRSIKFVKPPGIGHLPHTGRSGSLFAAGRSFEIGSPGIANGQTDHEAQQRLVTDVVPVLDADCHHHPPLRCNERDGSLPFSHVRPASVMRIRSTMSVTPPFAIRSSTSRRWSSAGDGTVGPPGGLWAMLGIGGVGSITTVALGEHKLESPWSATET
jgi:hypothetical protein